MASKDGTKPPTMKEVAARAGVDASIVSRLLNNDPRLSVSSATRQRVESAIRDLGYRPNLAARALRTSRGLMAAFVLPEFTNPVYSRIVAGANRRAVELGYAIVIGEVHGGAAEEGLKQLHDYRSRGVDGVLLAAGVLEDETIRSLSSGDMPVIVVNRAIAGLRRWAVVDYEAGSRTAAEHITRLGHRSLVALAGPPQFDNGNKRAADFARFAAELGDARTARVDADELSVDGGYQAARRLLVERPDVTAVFTTTLLLAVGVLLAAREAGLAVPRDLSVIAMQDADLARYTYPPLTTVAMPMEELGAAAFDHLMAVIDQREPEPTVVASPPVLMVRESTAPPRS